MKRRRNQQATLNLHKVALWRLPENHASDSAAEYRAGLTTADLVASAETLYPPLPRVYIKYDLDEDDQELYVHYYGQADFEKYYLAPRHRHEEPT